MSIPIHIHENPQYILRSIQHCRNQIACHEKWFEFQVLNGIKSRKNIEKDIQKEKYMIFLYQNNLIAYVVRNRIKWTLDFINLYINAFFDDVVVTKDDNERDVYIVWFKIKSSNDVNVPFFDYIKSENMYHIFKLNPSCFVNIANSRY